MKPLYTECKQKAKIEDILYDGEAKAQGQAITFNKVATNYRFLVLIAENNRAAILYPILNQESSCTFGNFYVFNNGWTMTLTNTSFDIKKVIGVK